MEKIYNILLLTNRDSDNLGDQVIEECDIAIIKTIMHNLGFGDDEYKIHSRAAGMITKKYMATRDPELLKSAEKSVETADLIVFGGAPIFNFKYQMFYERTALTLELAEKYGRPVLFSAIGVEGYDEEDEKCQRLKKTLNFDCVKQITTRDDMESLIKYRENENTVIGKVADPAVFTSEVFADFKQENGTGEKKKIGLFILRANGFIDNGVDFDRHSAALMWKELTQKLKAAGYDYELITSGHFGDEAFMEDLFRKYDISLADCVFNMNNPESLIAKISSYDAIVSTRLHPSIISFSLGVPAVGLVWNSKVKHFYENIGYPERVVEMDGVTTDKIVEKISEAVETGVEKDSEYLMTVYDSLFDGFKRVFCPNSDAAPYTYEELGEKMYRFQGTTEKEQLIKLERKFRRAYEKYNQVSQKHRDAQKKLSDMKSIKSLTKMVVKRIIGRK